MRKDEVRDYYDRLTAVDIGAIARELLGGRITAETRTELHVDCPRHASQTKASLRVSLHEGLWTCFGCRVGGDVLQLVEFVNHGTVTAGVSAPMPQSHRDARDWLAQRAGLPPLQDAGVDPERIESVRANGEAIFAALSAVADVQNAALLEDADLLAWVTSQWGFSVDVVKQFKLGLGGTEGELEKLRALGHTDDALIATGSYSIGRGRMEPFFRGRVTFPYFDRGRVVYMIGRRSPRTADEQFEKAKYKKLPVHDERAHPKVSPLIDNGALWGEGILLTKPTVVLLTEGVADAVAAQSIGFPTVSPVTIRLRKDDVPRIARRMKSVGRVVILQDNEFSGIGELAAVRTALMFRAAGIECDVAVLPLGERQTKARLELAQLIGSDAILEASAAPPDQRRKIALRQFEGNENATAKAEALIEASKIDLAEWIREGGTAAQLEQIVAAAAHPAVYAARSIDFPEAASEDQRIRAAREVLDIVAEAKPAEQEQALRALRDRTKLPLELLRRETREKKREQKEHPTPNAHPQPIPRGEPGTCSEAVELAIAEFKSAQRPVHWETIGETIYRWFTKKGARFFKTRTFEPCVFWRDQVYRLNAQDAASKNELAGMLYEEAGIVPSTTGHKTALMVVAAKATRLGERCDEFTWVHSDIAQPAVWIATGNERHEILRISPTGVDVLPNGINRDRVILKCDPAFLGFDFDKDVDAGKLDEEFARLIGHHLACNDLERGVLRDWLFCFPLIEFAGTRPVLRLEGGSGSGKTMGAKLSTTWIFGAKREKKATDAANYSDAARNPLVALDNIEAENFDQSLSDFILTAVTGITKQKRASGSDTALIEERPNCLIMSTGIEPLGAELEEMQSRTIVIEFNTQLQNPGHIEATILAKLRESRPALLSMLMKRTAIVLELIANNGHARAIEAIRKRMGDHHAKRRCDEFLALMYLQRVAAAPPEKREEMLDRVDWDFISAIESMNATTDATSRESSPIGLALDALFKSFLADKDGARDSGLKVAPSLVVIEDATARDLFSAMLNVARKRGIPFKFKSVSQFARRMKSAVETLDNAGFEIKVGVSRSRSITYTIRWRVDGSMPEPKTGRDAEGSRDVPDDEAGRELKDLGF